MLWELLCAITRVVLELGGVGCFQEEAGLSNFFGVLTFGLCRPAMLGCIVAAFLRGSSSGRDVGRWACVSRVQCAYYRFGSELVCSIDEKVA